jgi:NADPH:quinone reductase-like Zn-dependent oxidoreductase
MPEARRRIIVKKPGGYSAFDFDETPLEAPGPGQVQIDVRACGINFADISVRLGLYAAAKDAYPLCPGLEFAGIARRTGSGVSRYSVGDRVFGVTRFGAYTTVINCPVEHIWPLPETWDFEKGAAFPVAYLTAYYGLHNIGQLRDSDTALVHSAAGGVGTALIHLLSVNNERTKVSVAQSGVSRLSVGVVGRPEKVSHVKSAGAKFVIDKSSEPLWKRAEEISPEGYDLILDANGASTLRDSYRHIRSSGRLLVYGFASMFSHSGRKNWLKLAWDYLRTPRFSPFDLTGANKSICGFNLIYLFEKVELFRDIMNRLLDLDSEGLIPPMPVTSFPFEDIVKAHQAIESGNTIGKLILKI